jgi:hypothetical protein
VGEPGGQTRWFEMKRGEPRGQTLWFVDPVVCGGCEPGGQTLWFASPRLSELQLSSGSVPLVYPSRGFPQGLSPWSTIDFIFYDYKNIVILMLFYRNSIKCTHCVCNLCTIRIVNNVEKPLTLLKYANFIPIMWSISIGIT